MIRIKKNKKGFVGDFFFYMVFLFIMAILFVTIYYAFSVLNDSWQGIDEVGPTSRSILNNYVTTFVDVWDWVMVFWVLGFMIALVVIGIVLRTHPMLMSIAMVLVTIVGGMVSVYLANAYDEFANSPVLNTFADDFNKISFIFVHYPHIMIVLGAIFIITLFSKSRSDLGI